MRLSSWIRICVVGLVACGDDAGEDPIADAGADALVVPDLDRSACVPDESAAVTPRCGGAGQPACGTWIKVEVNGAVCSDGSPYKIFVNYTNASNNLEVMFEPGGACWDYPSCSGTGGIRGAANPQGIPDDHMIRTNYQFLNLLRRGDDNNPVKDWNMVFIPYCTGDVHTGDKVATYQDPAGGAPLTFRHVGHDNVMKSIAWIKASFTATIPRLLVTGCSAGGIGALQNYTFVREGLSNAQCGYLLNDSGPLFHSDGPSKQLHDTIRAAWNTDSLLDALRGEVDFDSDALQRDFGLLNALLGDRYPHDRLAMTVYRMDLDYSLYSYQRFFPGSTAADIHDMFNQDIAAVVKDYDRRSNMAYFIPNFRTDNCSHCVSIPPIGHDVLTALTMPWLGSEIEAAGLDLEQFIIDLLDASKPLASYLEDRVATEQFSAEQSAECLEGGTELRDTMRAIDGRRRAPP